MSFLITENNSEIFPYRDHSYPRYKSDKGHNEKALQKLLTIIEKGFSHYSVLSILRIDLHPEKYSNDNKVISSFLTKKIITFEKQYSCKVSYFFAREQSKSDKQHYHLALFFSGHKVKSAYAIEQRIKEGWQEQCGGAVHFVEKPLYVVERGNKCKLDPAIYRLSYLTKNCTKENNDLAKSYGSNRSRYKNSRPESDIFFVDPKITYRNRKNIKNSKIAHMEGSHVHGESTFTNSEYIQRANKMTLPSQQILEIIATHPNIKAKNIAQLSGLSKKSVNKRLYKSLGHKVVRNSDFQWSLIDPHEQSELASSYKRRCPPKTPKKRQIKPLNYEKFLIKAYLSNGKRIERLQKLIDCSELNEGSANKCSPFMEKYLPVIPSDKELLENFIEIQRFYEESLRSKGVSIESLFNDSQEE